MVFQRLIETLRNIYWTNAFAVSLGICIFLKWKLIMLSKLVNGISKVGFLSLVILELILSIELSDILNFNNSIKATNNYVNYYLK